MTNYYEKVKYICKKVEKIQIWSNFLTLRGITRKSVNYAERLRLRDSRHGRVIANLVGPYQWSLPINCSINVQ